MSTRKKAIPVEEAAAILGAFIRTALEANYGEDAPVYALIVVDTETDAAESASCIVSNAGEVEQVRAMLVSTLYATYKELETRDLPSEAAVEDHERPPGGPLQ